MHPGVSRWKLYHRPYRSPRPGGSGRNTSFADASAYFGIFCISFYSLFLLYFEAFSSIRVLTSFFHECDWKRPVRREVDGGTADSVRLELTSSHACQFGDHLGTHDIERTVGLGTAEADERVTLILEEWNHVADALDGLGCRSLDVLAKFVKSGPQGLF